MAARKIGIGGFEAAAFANARGAGLSVGFGGRPWEKLVPILKRSGLGPRHAAPGSPELPTGFGGSVAPGALPLSPAQPLQAQVDSIGWYHTIDLGHGVRTRGQFDHTDLLSLYELPASVAGQRVLDVATFDGFWAFEFERRGAAEVIALDIDKPADLDFPPKILAQINEEQRQAKFGRGFEIAKAALQSKVQRVVCSVYDLEPARYGMFDIVHSGDFLLHLNNPVRALQNMAAVCSGYALISEVYAPELDQPGGDRLIEYRGGSSDVTWWRFSLSALKQMVLDAGFERVEIVNTFRYGQRGMPRSMHHVVLKAIT